ncbi:TIGD6 [Cordylochernes scorpioides]|uniref:TIGD6 n=1 Tax=Cordylochernes scorpioides TaxID=51811 RepID=A0ABY6LU65_9ARAC|nr:TIGD6 [Cordylochernes scorpioides]
MRQREKNLIIYGLEGAEGETTEESRGLIQDLISNTMQISEDLRIEQRRRLTKNLTRRCLLSSTLKHDHDREFPAIEEALFRWIWQANAMKLTINGNILKEKALLLALKMGQDNFEAKARSMDANSVATWKGEIIPSLLDKYSPQDIFNAYETGLF